MKLTPTITPTDANKKDLGWKAKDPKIASVDKYGRITAKRVGTTVITATTKDGSKKTATCTVTVKEKVVTKVSFTSKNVTLKVGESKILQPTIEPKDARNKTLTWKSSNTKVVTVTAKGEIKGVAVGTATITVTSKNKKTATCTVKVEKEATPSGGGENPSNPSGGGRRRRLKRLRRKWRPEAAAETRNQMKA